MLHDLSLKIKLPLYFTAMLATVVMVLSVSAYREVRQAQIEAAGERLRRLSDQLADLVAPAFEARRAEATSLARDDRVVAFLREPSSSPLRAAAQEALGEASEGAEVLTVDVRDRQGRRLLSVSDSARAPAVFEAGLGDEGELSPLLEVSGQLVSSASAGISSAGEILGTVSIWRPLQVVPTAWNAFANLIGLDGALLIGSPGGAWTDLVEVVPPPPIQLEEDIGSSGDPFIEYERAGSGPVFATVRRLGTAPRYLIVEARAEDVLAGAHAFLLRLSLLVPLALLVSAVSAWILGSTITRSLRATTSAAEAIAAGHIGRRVAVQGLDELGRLGTSFNAMAEQIQTSQLALLDLNRSLRTMLDGAPLPIIVVDQRGEVQLWNRASTETFGWSAEEALGQPNLLVDAAGAPLDLPGPSTDSIGYECRTYRKDGQPVDLFVASGLTHDPTGRVDGHMLVCEDITSRKKVEEQLARYAEDLARSNAELEDFAYVASHDLREPIRMVRSFTQLLAQRYSDRLDEDGRKYVDFAMDGAKRMDALVRDLLEYSRLEGQRTDPSPTGGDELLRQALAIHGRSIEETGAVITYDALPTVNVDGDQLLRVFQNLIGNAIKFHGDEPPQVHVSCVQDDDLWLFSVQDRGIGIQAEHLERIFVIFKRLHGPGEFGGTGIGLAICRKIVERHGGRIWVESTPGAGSTFYFTLPRAQSMVA